MAHASRPREISLPLRHYKTHTRYFALDATQHLQRVYIADSVTKTDLDGFRSFLLKELNDHKDQLADQDTGSCSKAESALALSKQLKTDADIKFTHSGNERNFKFNPELREILATALELLESTDFNQVKDTLDKALALIDERNWKIRIADTTEAGWLTVKHYEASAVALDPKDDKKIRQAEREALREKAKLQNLADSLDTFHN